MWPYIPYCCECARFAFESNSFFVCSLSRYVLLSGRKRFLLISPKHALKLETVGDIKLVKVHKKSGTRIDVLHIFPVLSSESNPNL
jgi:hypothetical protein